MSFYSKIVKYFEKANLHWGPGWGGGGGEMGWQAFSKKKCSQKEGNTRIVASSSFQNVQLKHSAFPVVNNRVN